MVVAKRTKAAQRLTTALQSGALVRKYQAWLFGDYRGEHTWRHWLIKNEKTNEVAGFKEKKLESRKRPLA